MNQAKLILIALTLAGTAVSANAQSPTAKESFDEFRKGLLDDYSSFRKSILEDYDKFLEGAWSSYRQFKGEKRNPKPKPKTVPSTDNIPAPVQPTQLPDPLPADSPVAPAPEDEPVVDKPVDTKPATGVKPAPTPRPTLLPKIPTPAKPSVPATKPKPSPKPAPTTPAPAPVPTPSQEPSPNTPPTSPTPSAPAPETPSAPAPKPVAQPEPQPTPAPAPQGKQLQVKFYDMNISIPDHDYRIAASAGKDTYADQWRQLTKNKVADKVVPHLESVAKKYGFNDYLKFVLVRRYADAKFPNANAASRLSLTHYLMANMGYDIRLAALDNGSAALLVPFEQFVYARPYMKIDNKQFHIFCEDLEALPDANAYIYTCNLPKDADTGSKLNLILSGLDLPDNPRPFNIEYGGMKLTGNVNANIIPVLYRYPQMEIGGYAASTVSPQLRASIVAQMKKNLQGLPKTDAVNKLLQFVQSGFQYATDDDFHGFEKPYFVEETLYYPKCDCEDRAIFYAYLLWNALGVENHILNYPGHESAAVVLDDKTNGTAYNHNGKRFLISDPTYIGSRTGMCMPMFETTAPRIDHIYSPDGK